MFQRAGRAPDSNQQRVGTQLSGYGDLATASAGGFGELGAWGPRPSGINFGFYVQLQHMGQHVAAADAAWIASAGDRADTGNLTIATAAAGMAPVTMSSGESPICG